MRKPENEGTTRYKLMARWTAPPEGAMAGRAYEFTIAEGTKHECIRAFSKELEFPRATGAYQFWIERDNFILAIQVWGALLWLDKVPNPDYFHGPRKSKLYVPGTCD